MLRVGNSSWHYRIWAAGRSGSSRPKNLCRYFWHIMFKVIAMLVILGLALTALGLLVYAAIFETIGLLIGIGMIIGILGGAAVLVLVGGYALDRYDEKQTRVRQGLEPKKEPGVVRQYLKARKQQLCPLIEVIDE